MRALAVRPGTTDSLHLADIPKPHPGRGEVLVQVLEVGLDGTDKALRTGTHGRAPAGEGRLVIGHESLGRVVAIGPGAPMLREGDLVAATVRRPCPERCPPCAAGQVDLCSTGHYVERGIIGAHGYAADFYMEHADWLVLLPPALRDVGVLSEPLSVALKGIERAYAFQSAFEWQPRHALVMGAGPLGLLAALALRERGLAVAAVDRVGPEHPKADLVTRMGARYVQADGRPLAAVLAGTAPFDLIFDATGVSALIFQAMCLLNFNGVLCVAGLPEGNQMLTVPADCIGLELVLENRIVFGTVSSNAGHFRRAVALLERLEQQFPGVLGGIITGRHPIERYQPAFDSAVVKNVLVL